MCRIYFAGELVTGNCSTSVGTPYSWGIVVAHPHPRRLTLFRPSQGQGHFVMFCLILFLSSSITFVHCIQLTVPQKHQHLEIRWSNYLMPVFVVCQHGANYSRKLLTFETLNRRYCNEPGTCIWELGYKASLSDLTPCLSAHCVNKVFFCSAVCYVP